MEILWNLSCNKKAPLSVCIWKDVVNDKLTVQECQEKITYLVTFFYVTFDVEEFLALPE